LRLTWDMLGEMSMKLELWETSLVIELMKEKMTELKQSKFKVMAMIGVVVDDDTKMVNKEEFQEILNDSIDVVFNKTEKIFSYKNKIIMMALNMNML
jgi:hypothetical protein